MNAAATLNRYAVIFRWTDPVSGGQLNDLVNVWASDAVAARAKVAEELAQAQVSFRIIRVEVAL